MRHPVRVGTGPVMVVTALALCAVSIAVIVFNQPLSKPRSNKNHDNVISAVTRVRGAPVTGRAKIVDEIGTAFIAQIDDAVSIAKPAGDPVEQARYDGFMDHFKAELNARLRAHLDGYSDAELHSLIKPQWDLLASDLPIDERFREWACEDVSQLKESVGAGKATPREAQTE